jgi:hypothetical protein
VATATRGRGRRRRRLRARGDDCVRVMTTARGRRRRRTPASEFGSLAAVISFLCARCVRGRGGDAVNSQVSSVPGKTTARDL